MLMSGMGTVAALILFVPGLAAAVRRVHDSNKSGTFLLLALIPLIGWIPVLIALVSEGTTGPNRFGHPTGSVVSFDQTIPPPPPSGYNPL